jgi:hypothetical protein
LWGKHSSARRRHLDQKMNAIEPEESAQAVAAITDVAEEIRELVPAEGLWARKPRAEAGLGLGNDKFPSLIQKIGAASLAELERLIGELQEARAYLESEGERIQRETVGYAELSRTAMESVRIISETVGEWRKAGHPVRSTNAG